MTTNEAQSQLDTLKAEAAALPQQIKDAVNSMRAGEVRRLKAREDELADLIIGAEMDLITAQLAALPSAQEMARRGRQAQAELEAAEQAHKAAVEKLIAVKTLYNADMVSSLAIGQQRDRLMRARQELEVRFAVAAGEVVLCDGMGNPVPSTSDKTPEPSKGETPVSPFAGHSEIGRKQPAIQDHRLKR